MAEAKDDYSNDVQAQERSEKRVAALDIDVKTLELYKSMFDDLVRHFNRTGKLHRSDIKSICACLPSISKVLRQTYRPSLCTSSSPCHDISLRMAIL